MLLTLITFLPFIGALLILGMPKEWEKPIRGTAVAAAGVTFLLSLGLWRGYDPTNAVMQFQEQRSWIPSFGIQYHLGVDGLSVPLVVLTALLSLICVVYSFNIKDRVKEYFFFFLLLETGMTGVFVSLDFFLFYVFWELTLFPMYFLIGIWGGPQKEYAAIKFFLYTLFGSVFMLLGMLALYFASTPHTFDLVELARQHGQFAVAFQTIVFLALFLGFAIKVPAFPFHTWLPLAHVEAPTAVSVILAGVLLKMGLYGFMRVSFPILPEAAKYFAFPLGIIGLINIVYGALVAMAQTDLKKMVAYSSVSHMGFCLLGLASLTITGFNGSLLQMINHGLITGSMFLLVGVIYDRAHTRDISAFGGLGARLPVYTGFMTLATMASLGLPGLAGFVGEFLCFLGSFPVYPWITIVSVLGVVFTAAFFLRMIQKVFLGPLNPKWADLVDMDTRELLCVVPLAILTILFGVWPNLLLKVMDPTLLSLVNFIKGQ